MTYTITCASCGVTTRTLDVPAGEVKGHQEVCASCIKKKGVDAYAKTASPHILDLLRKK